MGFEEEAEAGEAGGWVGCVVRVGLFEAVREDCVNVFVKPNGRVEVEWEGNVINDGIADAVLAVLFTVESSPAAVKRKSIH